MFAAAAAGRLRADAAKVSGLRQRLFGSISGSSFGEFAPPARFTLPAND